MEIIRSALLFLCAVAAGMVLVGDAPAPKTQTEIDIELVNVIVTQSSLENRPGQIVSFMMNLASSCPPDARQCLIVLDILDAAGTMGLFDGEVLEDDCQAFHDWVSDAYRVPDVLIVNTQRIAESVGCKNLDYQR